MAPSNRLGEAAVLGVLPGATYAAGAAELRSAIAWCSTPMASARLQRRRRGIRRERLIGALDQPAGRAEESRQRIMAAVTKFSNAISTTTPP